MQWTYKLLLTAILSLYLKHSSAQQVILVEKDSLGAYKCKELSFVKPGLFDGFIPIKAFVYQDSVMTIERNAYGREIKKCVYKFDHGDMVKVRESSSSYIPPKDGYYLFADGSTY